VERDEILSTLRERILAFAASRMGKDIAEDLVQEVLVVLHEKYPEVTRLEELVPLSFQVLRFKLVSLRRKMIRRGEYTQVSVEDVQVPDAHADPGAMLERKLMSERLAAAVNQLGERCRRLFRLKLEGKSFAEIQTALAAGSINTVYTWDARCRKQLLDLLGGAWESGHEG
jgi:RNA polymerase sigma-70 factor (ECF subfamily)